MHLLLQNSTPGGRYVDGTMARDNVVNPKVIYQPQQPHRQIVYQYSDTNRVEDNRERWDQIEGQQLAFSQFQATHHIAHVK